MKNNTGGRGRRLTRALRLFLRDDRGAGAVFYVLGTMALLVTAAFIVDATTATGDAAQIKRATDAAALAVGRQAVVSGDENNDFDDQQMAELAFDYVRANLGLNAQLAEALSRDKVSVREGRSDNDYPTYTVAVSFRTAPELLRTGDVEQTIYSTAEVRNRSLEVALALPVTVRESFQPADLDVLKRVGKNFAANLIGDSDNAWLALVPYAVGVNVYDNAVPNRISRWMESGAENADGLVDFKGNAASFIDRRKIPDRIDNRLCLYRGMDVGENFRWEQSPANDFRIAFWHYPNSDDDSIAGISIDARKFQFTPYNTYSRGQAVSIAGNDESGQLVVSPACPKTPLLPLTNELTDIDDRLDALRQQRVNTLSKIDFALGWSAMALSPAFRGETGWNLPDDSLPKDFDEGRNERVKAIVMLIHSGSYQNTYGNETRSFVARLCSSFKARGLDVYLIATNPSGSYQNAVNSDIRDGLTSCFASNLSQLYLSGERFSDEEDEIQARLDAIATELHQKSAFVRLIE